MKRFFTLTAVLALLLQACGPKIYKTEDFESKTASHKLVALLPADVFIQLRPNEMKKITRDQLLEMQQKTRESIQDKMYTWFLKRSGKFKYTVSFQDISRTNALLAQAGITYNNIKNNTKDEIARILGVDAVITTRANMTKPMSEGAAVAIGVLFGSWGTTNDVETSIYINEGVKGNLVWKYDYNASGSIGSDPGRLVNALMRNASKKFPYNAK
jgi:hypothetical protein